MNIIFDASATTAIGVIFAASAAYASGILSATFTFAIATAMCAGMGVIAYYADNSHRLFSHSSAAPTGQSERAEAKLAH